jgi:hypothetical protein
LLSSQLFEFSGTAFALSDDADVVRLHPRAVVRTMWDAPSRGRRPIETTVIRLGFAAGEKGGDFAFKPKKSGIVAEYLDITGTG